MSIISKSDLRKYRSITNRIEKGITGSLNEWRSEPKYGKTTVFLSHKHSETEELDGAISLLKTFGINVYIDWLDEQMPNNTSGDTANRIKQKIRDCNKFVFLATEGAIDSKWCNWELGYGDSIKYVDHIAILPVKGSLNNEYSGSEYLQIYPAIEFSDGTEKNMLDEYIERDFYVFINPGDQPAPL